MYESKETRAKNDLNSQCVLLINKLTYFQPLKINHGCIILLLYLTAVFCNLITPNLADYFVCQCGGLRAICLIILIMNEPENFISRFRQSRNIPVPKPTHFLGKYVEEIIHVRLFSVFKFRQTFTCKLETSEQTTS